MALESLVVAIFCVKGNCTTVQTEHENVASLTNVECKSKHTRSLLFC